ncbi:MAG: glycosyltransferase [Bacteroidales bacterium]|nr:glycosyltransferase [Bacteroidales bacterium]
MSNISYAKISVIIPVYNVENYLEKCLDSIINQSFKELDIIIVDDGSTDNSGKICDRYASSDPRIRVIHQKNKGVASARNTGISISVADTIAFVDSDDWIERDMLINLWKGMTDTDADIAMCNFCYDYDNRSLPENRLANVGSSVYSSSQAINLLMEGEKIHYYVWNKLFRKDIIGKGFEEGALYEDILAMPQLLYSARRICYIPYVGYHYAHRQSSIVNRPSVKARIAYLSALCRQMIFIRSISISPEIYSAKLNQLATVGIGICRDEAEYHKYDTLQHRHVDDVISLLQPFEIEFMPIISVKKRNRYKMLKNNPKRFYGIIYTRKFIKSLFLSLYKKRP